MEQVCANAEGYRSEVIAHTETAQAYAYANEMTREATGVVGDYKWLSAQDERVCPICGSRHGERKASEQDSSCLTPAFAHIRCRCSEIGITG